MMNPPPLEAHLFGPLRVFVRGEPLPRMRTRSVEWLLALLVLRHGRAVDRARLAGALWPEGKSGIDWAGMRRDYSVIRDHIERVIPGFERFNARIEEPGGFALPHPVRDRLEFKTATGKARFTANDLGVLRVPERHLILQTVRSDDQFNTTIYGLDDRYRGIKQGRRVVFVNPIDRETLGIEDGQMVDLVSVAPDGERRAEDFRVVSYATAPGCAAAYFPETNVLVALDSVAKVSNTPVSKSIVIRLEPRKEM